MRKEMIMEERKRHISSEARVRTRARRNAITRAMLGTLAVAGAITIAIAAPKVLSLMKRDYADYIFPPNPKQRLHETAARLKRKGFVEFREVNGRKRMYITQKGLHELDRVTTHSTIQKPRRWDERWRIVIFDIPEKQKGLRNKIRSLVQGCGFFRLQNSVWVYPYDCEEVITLLKTNLRIGREVLYIIADAIEYDRPLRQHFGLPLE